MEFLLGFGISMLFVAFIWFIVSLIDEDNEDMIKPSAIGIIVGFILVLISGINLQHEKSLERGRLEGAQNPQYLKIKEINYIGGIPKDTVFVYEIPKILED